MRYDEFLEKRIAETMRELNKTDNRDDTLLVLGRLVTYYEILSFLKSGDIKIDKKLNMLKKCNRAYIRSCQY